MTVGLRRRTPVVYCLMLIRQPRALLGARIERGEWQLICTFDEPGPLRCCCCPVSFPFFRARLPFRCAAGCAEAGGRRRRRGGAQRLDNVPGPLRSSRGRQCERANPSPFNASDAAAARGHWPPGRAERGFAWLARSLGGRCGWCANRARCPARAPSIIQEEGGEMGGIGGKALGTAAVQQLCLKLKK